MYHYCIAILGLVFLQMTSCTDSLIDINEGRVNREKCISSLTSEFSSALAKVFAESKAARNFIKEEALKQFDFDYDVLYMKIRNEVVENGKTFEDMILGYMAFDNLLLLLDANPTLTIFIPRLCDWFSAEKWDVANEIPLVAYKDDENRILYVDSKDNIDVIGDNEMPVFPIVVVKPSERVVLKNTTTKNFDEETIVMTNNGFPLVFEYEEFNNLNNIKTKAVSGTNIPDQLKDLFEAKKIADINNIWHRDYIYYGIEHQDGRGAFLNNVSECIYSFELVGDPDNIYNMISDQESDPYHHEGKYTETSIYDRNNRANTTSTATRSQNKYWYNGNYEFLVKIYIANNQLASNEIIKGLSISPYDLFDLNIEYPPVRGSVVTILGVSNFKKYYLAEPLPLFEWNIEHYSSSIKISIEEKDEQQTIQNVVETTTTFATNFEFDFSYGEKVKVGAKFGASVSQQHRVSTTITTTQGSDQLGDVIVNFGDDVLIKDEMIEVSREHDRRTGNDIVTYRPAFNPKYTSGYYKIELAPLPLY